MRTNNWHEEWKLKRRFGRMISKQLPSIRQKETVAKMMGISRISVDTLESLALFKVFALMTYEHK